MKQPHTFFLRVATIFVFVLVIVSVVLGSEVMKSKIVIAQITLPTTTVWPRPVYGRLWSSNIGWVKLNCIDLNGDRGGCTAANGNYGVSAASSSGIIRLSGAAWSSNVGWVSFNAADVTDCTGSTLSSLGKAP